MATNAIYTHIEQARQSGRKLFSVLIDPDKVDIPQTELLVRQSLAAKVDLFLVGGSLMVDNTIERIIKHIKSMCSIPCILFPGSPLQLTNQVDALLFLSLISGRNPDLLIGQHVAAAPMLKKMNIEIIPTGYMLIDGGKPTTASYISNTFPIPHNKPSVAACTAMAGELLGMKLLYMDTGSGAMHSVSEKMIRKVKQSVDLPLIVGGGIRDAETARAICAAGADMIVVGTAIEENASVMFELAEAVQA